jgi:hypothetical protein
MGDFTLPLKAIQDYGEMPEIAVETGTRHGENTAFLAEHFKIVYTIEIDETLYAEACHRFIDDDVFCLHSDSAERVPHLAKEIVDPVLWYLDAHWWPVKSDPVGGQGQFPLWKELNAVKDRGRDIVVVDDVHAFSNPRFVENTGVKDWLNVNVESISQVLTPRKVLVVANHAVFWI